MDDFREYASNNLGKLIFVCGAFSLAIGVFSSSMFGTVLSAVTLFLGILMVIFGLFLQLGLFSDSVRSFSGVGMLLVCVAIVLLAFALVALEFLDVVRAMYMPIIPHGGGVPVEGKVLLITDRPYVWISELCLRIGLGSLVLGIGLKIAGLFRH